ncbi:MAG TPA: hypothetical protein VGJ97_02605 [Anaerolineaceae bacterium]|jgi:hypothetical protein
MHRASSSFHSFFYSAALFVALAAIFPGSAVLAQGLTAPSSVVGGTSIFLPLIRLSDPAAPSQTAQQVKYSQLRADLYGLDATISDAAGFRMTFANFVYTERLSNHNTQLLDGATDNFDSFIDLASKARQAGIEVISSDPGLDSQGNLADGAVYDTAMQQGANADWTARSYLNQAMGVLHSSLNLYHQVWGYSIPDIPKWNLLPFNFPA